MKKTTKQIYALAVAVLATAGLLFTAYSEVVAQSKIQYDVLYECPIFPHNFKVISCPSEKFCDVLSVNLFTPSASSKGEMSKTSIIETLAKGGCKVGGKSLQKWDETTGPDETEREPQTKNAPAGRFKVGERVLASPAFLAEEKYFEKCTVIKDMMIAEGADAYRILCDDPKGGIGRASYIKVPFIKAWANAVPAPKTPDCPFNEPPGTVTRSSKPSGALFQRVIYEWRAGVARGRKVGITFQSFQMGAPYRNVVMSVPGIGAQLKNDGAPQGATIYPLKTKYLFCDKYTDSTIRWLIESQFACFKNKDGDWICPVDSVPKILEQIYLPNK